MNKFTSVQDIESLPSLVDQALKFKANQFHPNAYAGKSVGLVFLNPSLRTRLSSLKAARNLGAEAVVLDISKDGWALEFEDGKIMDGNKAEHIKEAAAVMGRYFNVLGIRTFPGLANRDEDYAEELLNAFIKYAGVPVVSLESATRHPLQSLADVVSIKEKWNKTEKPKVVLTWAPHVKALPQAVPNSFVEWMKVADVDLTITHPEGYDLAQEFSEGVNVTYNQQEALKDADFVYVKNWSSYTDYGKILSQNESWRFSMEHLALTNNAKIMHCLPVRRGVVMDDAVLDSPNAIHLDQAENRVYAAQAVFNELLK